MFRIKICGLTNVDDAQVAVGAGADAIGLNFYSGSKRWLATWQGKQIATAMPAGVAKIGVFVNAGPEEIRSIAAEVGLDAVQLHGDEPPQALAELKDLRVIKAFRVADDSATAVDLYLDQCATLGGLPAMILVDAFRPDAYGGTGALVNWEMVAALRSRWPDLPLALAGGLTPANVAAAIGAVRPAGVDTASGVEAAPGRKDPELVQAFVTAAREAFGTG